MFVKRQIMEKKMRLTGISGAAAIALSAAAGCDVMDDGPTRAPGIPETEEQPMELKIDVSQKGHVGDMYMEEDGSYTIILPDNADPYVYMLPIEEELDPENTVLAFEYMAEDPIDKMEVFFWNAATKYDAAYATFIAGADEASEWTPYSARLKNHIEKFYWGNAEDYLRLDLGETNRNGSTLRMRNIVLRPMNEAEQAAQDAEDALAGDKLAYAQGIEDYLDGTYPCSITGVEVTADRITVTGTYTGDGKFFLADIPPFVDMHIVGKVDACYRTALDNPSFTVTLDRYVSYSNVQYDRLLSKWAVFREDAEKDVPVSHARYADPDRIATIGTPLERIVPANKKGLGGLVPHGDLLDKEIQDLGLTSGTINILPTIFMGLSQRGTLTTPYEYLGRTYYIDETYLSLNIDAALKVASSHGMSVAGIILIQKAAECADPAFGELVQHPDFDNGVYTMPDMTSAESLHAYAAMISFLCERYSKEDMRISHWIVHNEIDGGVHWTNMGTDIPAATYMDTYLKSIRTVYNIMCQYDPNAEAFVSLAHGWTKSAGGGWYSVTDVLDLMNRFSRAEGDFFWAPAYHSYASAINDPRVWEDENVSFSMNTNYVSMKNLEVLDRWVQDNANRYKGTVMRKVWLSEAGVGSGTTNDPYDDTVLADQAAGTAYSWKKINALEGIEGIQWHNWFDNKSEGAKLGLRKYDDDEYEGEPKPAWYTYQAAGTENEDTWFESQGYATVVGEEWGVIHPVTD